MASQVMRITLKAYDHQLVDQSAAKIVDTVKKTGSKVSGPVPMPTKKEVVTILRAVHLSLIHICKRTNWCRTNRPSFLESFKCSW